MLLKRNSSTLATDAEVDSVEKDSDAGRQGQKREGRQKNEMAEDGISLNSMGEV